MTPFRQEGLVQRPLTEFPVDLGLTAAIRQEAAELVNGPAVRRAMYQLAQVDPAAQRQAFEVKADGRLQLQTQPKTYLVQVPSLTLRTWAQAEPWRQALARFIGGQLGALHAAHLWYALVPPSGWAPIMSQCWHRDPYEKGMERIVKVFWYLEDVDAENGPFEYLRGSQERIPPPAAVRDRRYIHPRYTAYLNAHPARVVCEGPTDTVIMADTSGVHRGGLCRSRPRLSATLVYGASW